MKLKKLSIAVSSLLVSGAVYAHAPSVTPDLEIFMSGASAQDKGIAALFQDLCVTGSLDVYKDDGAKPGKAHSAYFCTVDNAKVPGLAATSPKVLFHKRSKGGSAQGVNPVIDELAIDAMAINNSNCTETSAGSQDWRCTISNPGDLTAVVSDAGVSDVNPEMFVGQNTPAGNDPVDSTAVAQKMEVRSAAALVFGVPVTTSLRNALQEAQFGVADACVGAETEACMPSMSKHQIASIISGQLKSWSAFKVAGTPLTSVATTLPTDTKVTYCRRVNGSGTQAQKNAKYLNYPSRAGALAPKAAPGNPFTGPVVIENSGSGDVSLCLNDFNNGTNTSTQNAAGKTAWAVGVQSTEKNADLGDDFRFIKIDGVAPTVENAANGKYVDWVELTYQWRKPVFNGPTGDKLTIIEQIANNAGAPGIIASKLNTSYVHPWGQGGYLAVSTNGHTPAANGILDLANPVTPYSHAVGGSLDNCRVPVVNPSVQNSAL
jgi:ABC-type phosphate transport system substrate-binding protein